MNRYWFSLSIVLLLLTTSQAQPRKFRDLIGYWEIAGKQNEGAVLQISDSNNIFLIYMGETRKITNVRIDFSKSPLWFDFTATDNSGSSMNVKSLVECTGEYVMKWQLFIDEDRSPYFTSTKGELLYLKKKNNIMPTAVNQ